MRGLRLQRPRQQIGPIRFEHEAFIGNAADRVAQCLAPAFVADPAGYPDREPHAEAVLEFRSIAGEAMQHRARQHGSVFAQHRQKIRMRLALVEEERHVVQGSESQLQFEGASLLRGRRIVPVVIQAALTGSDRHRIRIELGESRTVGRVESGRMVWMHAGGRPKDSGPLGTQCDRAGTVGERAASDDHRDDAGGARPCDDLGPVPIIAVMGKVDADVDQCNWLHAGSSACENGALQVQAADRTRIQLPMTLDQEALSVLRKEAGHGDARYQTIQGRRKRIAIIIAVVLVALLAVWWLARSSPLVVEVSEVEAPPAEGGLAVLNASGYVTARRQATVSSKVTGQIAELLFEEGAAVEQGQVLARLDAATASARHDIALRQRDAASKALTEVEVRLADAIRNRDRARALRPQNLVSQSALDAADAEAAALAARLEAVRAELAVAESALRLSRQDLDDLVIRAPFTGVIVSKDAQPGEMVSPTSAGGGFTRTGIATIVDMESREIEVDVNEAYINRVTASQRVTAVLDAYPEWTIPARVIAIVPTADRQKATVRVRIGFEQLDPRILPDMGVKVRFFDDSSDAPAPAGLVPATAVLETDGQTYLWRLTDGKAERVEVRALDEQSGMRPVLSGVAVGDMVLANPPAGLEEGARLKARDAG